MGWTRRQTAGQLRQLQQLLLPPCDAAAGGSTHGGAGTGGGKCRNHDDGDTESSWHCAVSSETGLICCISVARALDLLFFDQLANGVANGGSANSSLRKIE